jgi:hypothetical protein
MAKKRARKRPAAKPPTARPANRPDARDRDAASQRDAKSQTSRDRGAVTAASSALVPAPAFFFGYEVAWVKLLVVRVVLFGMLALDSLLQLSHAPRYGTGFNVAQLPGLDALGPGRVGYGVGQLLCAYLLVFAACGVATRVVLPVATALYGWLYFGSHLDSYQHHYLVWLLLLLACFVPWQRPRDATAATPVRAWAVRVILIQLGIVYLWAAISKMSPAWTDGTTLSKQLAGGLRGLVDGTIGFKRAANLVVLTELALAATVWLRPAWRVALPLGVGLHAMIMYSGLEIGMFAWLMLALYLLVVPDRAFVWIAERVKLPRPAWPSQVVAVAVGLIAIATASVLAGLMRFPDAVGVGLALAAVPVAIAVAGKLRGRSLAIGAAGLAHVAAIALWVAVDRGSSQVGAYYRFWAGSSRRLGDLATAERAYRRLTEVTPDDATGHFRLGQLLLGRGADVDALAELHRAQQLAPARARAFLTEALYLRAKGRAAEALDKARAAVAAEPADADARALLASLTGAAPPAPAAPRPAPTPDDDDTEAP